MTPDVDGKYRIMATQVECDADFARKRAEQVAAMAEARIMANFLSGAHEWPWWKFWA